MIELVNEKVMDEKEMRAVFAETMADLAAKDDRVVYLDCDLMNSISMRNFASQFPDRTVNCGIQEANMIGVAAGMSATGMIPFTHTFGPFASRRVMDQVFVSAAYAKLNIRMIGSDPGITATLNGGTHMPFEDIGMMRCVPEITVIEPTDAVMLRDVLVQTKDCYGVYYIRLSRKKSRKIFKEGSSFTIGKAVTLREGKDVTIICTGICVDTALDAADVLAKEGIDAGVINMFTIKPVDKEAVIDAAKKTGAIVTAENHNIINGLGSAVCEVLGETVGAKVERVGVKDRFGEVGDMNYLANLFELDTNSVVAAAKRAVMRKRGECV